MKDIDILKTMLVQYMKQGSYSQSEALKYAIKELGKLTRIKEKAESVLRRDVMEKDCLDFTELADKMVKEIKEICDE